MNHKKVLSTFIFLILSCCLCFKIISGMEFDCECEDECREVIYSELYSLPWYVCKSDNSGLLRTMWVYISLCFCPQQYDLDKFFFIFSPPLPNSSEVKWTGKIFCLFHKSFFYNKRMMFKQLGVAEFNGVPEFVIDNVPNLGGWVNWVWRFSGVSVKDGFEGYIIYYYDDDDPKYLQLDERTHFGISTSDNLFKWCFTTVNSIVKNDAMKTLWTLERALNDDV
jgi:hypothetical protein